MDYFLLHATHGEARDWLGKVLGGLGTLVAEGGAQEAFIERVGELRPGLVFLHFSPELAGASARLGEQLLRLFPGLPLVAVGRADDPGVMLAALRMGVKDFIDLRDAPADAEAVVKRLAVPREQVRPAEAVRQGKIVALLGARPGVGVTSLAVNLAAAARRHLPLREKSDARAEVLLLDLGLPARDGALYLNLAPGFHFVEAVRNLRRFDQVFVQTALMRHANGVCVLPLPGALGELRDISYSETIGLLERLRAFFDMQVIDLGGFGNAEFTAQIVKAADSVVLVAEQSVGAIVSAAELVHELRAREVERDDLHLLVSRFDARLGVDAAQIARRVGVQSVATLPDCREALVLAMNRGAVLADDDPHDPYVRALAELLARLGYRPEAAKDTSLLGRMKEKLPEALRAKRVARTGS
ncbi:AAA family ATPase [Cupriavidus oxalaticus]|uniref:Flp pilus assembly ATPase CpaE n=1 Tax=Cupriavidus oxalaticus TaxID=96344 RepID=A0A375GI93_9BURK|nr:pilus assembly protein [Cupriavidus oxalaticus]QRQ84387.1 pilus assembly protein [Cupriavidus oxalaticus]QRQ91526.1 pilus assembly protein [Cupriavidus oxalaticus]WQD86096.1 pilus assembly protein [Cupriavidus oxalaticus]SPC10565.1 Flp pilus assembly ATPase CpaE [Cupriavidus oxalaticus]SPC19612.1 Flp pilus assembly ATPase CpaE [Cupriavidus oxalaticus]